ncbi:MAG: hypothetical protein H0X47_15100 [Nitrospirales bacterium]|nr:hypothetical protein [Nitrospirales bacterium]
MRLEFLSLIRFFVAVVLLFLLSSCSVTEPSASLKATVQALLDGSGKCVQEVRDQGLKYENARNCTALGPLSKQYIDAGGGTPETPLEVEIDFERARVQAWMARALSESRNPALMRIW